MKKGHFLFLSALMLLSVFFTSCGETEDAADEFDNWKERNETYFNNLFNKAKNGSSDMKVFTSWSLNEDVAVNADDHIVVQVLERGTGSGCPIYTDSVQVHYRGRLIPSASYNEGYVFDQSYLGDFNWNTIDVARDENGRDKVCLDQDFVPGFTTALMNMHIGDRWRVYIPYQLGFGSWAKPTCSYSNLIFDVALVDFWHPGEHRPVFKSR